MKLGSNHSLDSIERMRIVKSGANSNRKQWEQHFTYLITNYYNGKSFFTQEEFMEITHAN